MDNRLEHKSGFSPPPEGAWIRAVLSRNLFVTRPLRATKSERRSCKCQHFAERQKEELGCPIGPGGQYPAPMTRWEYRTVVGLGRDPGHKDETPPVDLHARSRDVMQKAEENWVATLNDLGSEGWELVSYSYGANSLTYYRH
jgi:hypothetical protein